MQLDVKLSDCYALETRLTAVLLATKSIGCVMVNVCCAAYPSCMCMRGLLTLGRNVTRRLLFKREIKGILVSELRIYVYGKFLKL